MPNYLKDHKNRIIGTIEDKWDKRHILYDNQHNCLGYYDETKDQTYDSYGGIAGEGDLLQDLPYMPHKLKFPLPEPEHVSFTTYNIEKAGSIPGKRSSIRYWDDGQCKICNRVGRPTCHIQGLPGMCETCYRFFAMYSQKDNAGLEGISYRRPVTIRQIQDAIEKTKAPLIAASKAAEQAAKKMLFNAFIETPGNPGNIAYNASDAAPDRYQKVVKTAPQHKEGINQNRKTASIPQNKKKHLRWYHWILLILLLNIIIEFVIPLAAGFVILLYQQ